MESQDKFLKRLWSAVRSAFRPALSTAVWIIKLMVPISLAVAVLDYAGVMALVSYALSPLFSLMGLSGESAVVYLTSAFGSLFSGLAVMATIGVDYRQATIIAVMVLICHNLIIETAIQKKAWASAPAMVILRIATSLLAGIALNHILPADMDGNLFMPDGVVVVAGWGDVFLNWLMAILPLLLRMLILIVAMNVLQGILREFGILKIIAWPMRPVMKVFGLPESTSFLWIISNVIGITYGGAAVVDEVERGSATKSEARLLNTHIAISHSLLEDTLVFVSIGLPVFWLMVPRILFAIAAVWIQRLFRILRKS